MKLILALILSVMAFATDLPKDSVYQLQGEWRNQGDKVTSLSSFRGTPVVVAMTFTGCQYSCPLTIKKLESIENDIKKNGIKNYHLVIASFDSERDLPKALSVYMKKMKLSEEKWTFLSPKSDEDVRELAIVLGITYQKVEGGDFSHSNEINLLDSEGRVVYKLKGVSSNHKELTEKLKSYDKK